MQELHPELSICFIYLLCIGVQTEFHSGAGSVLQNALACNVALTFLSKLIVLPDAHAFVNWVPDTIIM